MAGTLLVYDQAFPRATTRDGHPIRNTPAAAELRDNHYPVPCELLPIPQTDQPDRYARRIIEAAQSMAPLSRLIIFGHGRVVNAAVPSGTTRVTTGIIIGAADLTAANARQLAGLRTIFAPGAQAELWVCEAATAGEAGGQSGRTLCQAIADALGVTVVGATEEQEYETVDQHEAVGGGWQSTARFLPWEGDRIRFEPHPLRSRVPRQRR